MAVKITINGKELIAEEGKTILQVALENGIYIPHFCYHPRLEIRGSCRMCLVKIEGMPKLQISCATRIQDGMVVDSECEEVRQARKAVLEFMLKNHPIDCPVCDKAGECTLQNYYFDYDLAPSRLNPLDAKVKKGKRLIMGPTLVLDQERCILCTRCVRFMRDIAKDECLTPAERGDRSVITTFPGKEVNNPYSLCLTDICPVGAWTSRDFRFKKRVWFLTSTPSICPYCARGCNIWLDHENGVVYRIRPRENEEVNQSWACDEGRLAYKAINENRLLRARVSENGSGQEVSLELGINKAVQLLEESKGRVLGLVSASASLEEAEAFKKLILGLGGEPAYYCRKQGEDDFLLKKADRDANCKGMEKLGISELKSVALAEIKLVVVLESLYSEGVELADKPMVVLSPKVSELVERAKVSLPITSYAESEGSFVNFEGIEQKFYPALAPRGDARNGVEIINELAKRLEISE